MAVTKKALRGMYAAVENYFFNVRWGWIDGTNVPPISPRLWSDTIRLLTVPGTAKMMERWSSRWRANAEP